MNKNGGWLRLSRIVLNFEFISFDIVSNLDIRISDFFCLRTGFDEAHASNGFVAGILRTEH